VIPMDNAPIHMKASIEAECARFVVITLFLPSYGYELNSVGLMIDSARQLLQRIIVVMVNCSLQIDVSGNTF